ncbi:MAG: secondary thiamine-phosphate synthase enzyme YjbQ [Candidatus Eisenbacteria bacterium]|nr:secondary thiamine-phosphate synthase enzyme YjbQ [Candidatus Eisenbacteria bacterium]
MTAAGIVEFEVRTRQRVELLLITDSVERIVRESGVKTGIARIWVPHTTAAITVNENADPDVRRDILLDLDRLLPEHQDYYRHGEGNSAAHLRASLFGFDQTIWIEDGRLHLGTWQGIYFCEFDGPRTRTVHVRIVPEREAEGRSTEGGSAPGEGER